MDEASNFCDGACYKPQKVVDTVKNKLRYIPGGRDLDVTSIAVDAKHANDFLEIDTHSLFGYMEVQHTHNWLKKY